MATFKVTKTTTVAELKNEFQQQVGGLLRVYNGRSEAADDATLVSLGAKEGVLECRTSRTVGKFEEAFQTELNLKVKVYTKDNWVKVLDGITLATVKDLPNGMTKAKMEEYLAYQRDDETSEENEKETNQNNKQTTNMAKADELIGLLGELTGWDNQEKIQNLLKEVIPEDVVIYTNNEDYDGDNVVDPIEVSVDDYDRDCSLWIKGTQFKREGSYLKCVQLLDSEYDELNECYWNISNDARNYTGILRIIKSFKAGNYGTEAEVSAINFLANGDGEEDY